MDVVAYNREAWDHQTRIGNRWTIPATPETIAAARRGEWEVALTPTKPVPREWFPRMDGCAILCLASGGGQQGPILAAAGAHVVVFDNSPGQLGQDRFVAEREGLSLETIQGSMTDTLPFASDCFDLVFHPCSNCFVADVNLVWHEVYRVLRPGGILLAGFVNPLLYVFDDALAETGTLVVRHSIPYSDATSLSDEERRRYTEKNEPLVFGHSLEDQIGGQLAAGFLLTGFFEDKDPSHPLAKHIASFVATRAVKPG